MTQEIRKMYEEKRDFIKALETALLIDQNNVKSIDYKVSEELPREIITITYKNNHKVRIMADANSNGANAKEIIAEIYGGGAHGRMRW